MNKFYSVLLLLFTLGCGETPNKADHAAQLQQYIDGWDKMGMWLPAQEQIDLFHLCLPDSEKPLTTALDSSSYEVRMRAAYVIGEIGEIGNDARGLGPVLDKRLQNEPDRLVRLYLYKALQGVHFDEPTTIEHMKERFASLDETNPKPEPGESKSDYLDADEKIRIAEALYVLDNGPDKMGHLDYILKWLQDPEEQQTPVERDALWERRLGAVLALEKMPDANDAIPLLEALQSKKDAPPWVSVHVPRVLESLK